MDMCIQQAYLAPEPMFLPMALHYAHVVPRDSKKKYPEKYMFCFSRKEQRDPLWKKRPPPTMLFTMLQHHGLIKSLDWCPCGCKIII